jgi:hypothetical protein
VNICCSVNMSPDYFQSLDHFAFVNVKWVSNVPRRPVPHRRYDMAAEPWLCTLREVLVH